MRALKNRNKHKLGKPLQFCQNHQIELGKKITRNKISAKHSDKYDYECKL